MSPSCSFTHESQTVMTKISPFFLPLPDPSEAEEEEKEEEKQPTVKANTEKEAKKRKGVTDKTVPAKKKKKSEAVYNKVTAFKGFLLYARRADDDG